MQHRKLPDPFVDVRVESDLLAVRSALDAFLQALVPLDLEAEESAAVELVLAEVLNNIVEHAYPPPSQAGPIQIRGRHRRDGVHIDIIDEGCALPNGVTPLGIAPKVDVDFDSLPEGGFGWFLIKDLAKDVVYDRMNGQNRLQMRVAVAVH